MKTRQVIAIGLAILVADAAIYIMWRMFKPRPVVEMSVTRAPWPAKATQIQQVGNVSIYLIQYRGAEFIVTSVGEVIPVKP